MAGGLAAQLGINHLSVFIGLNASNDANNFDSGFDCVMSYRRILQEIGRQVRHEFGRGKVADYIPALARVSPDKFGIAVCTVEGDEFLLGDAEEPFSIQSISKVLTLSLALKHEGAKLWRRVGREPSGNRFNSLVQLEHEHGIPRNPFINAGALVITDCLIAHGGDTLTTVLDYHRYLSRGRSILYDEEVARSEGEHGHLNAAMAHFLKSHGNLRSSVDEVLDAYFHHCSLAASCLDLARAFLHLANEGRAPNTGEMILPKRLTKRVNALMMTCGLYDAVGNFAFRVGIPAKSGVGGGIVGVIPRVLSICVWAPELDTNGNSHVGTKALELFTTKTQMSVF